jgi:TetR/AcrR family transcriptional regulator
MKAHAGRRAGTTEREADGGTEQRILDAASKVFLQQGTAGARMDEIAAAAGVNQALLHYYFRTKDRLAEAVFRRAARQLLPPVLAILGSSLDLEEKVTRVVEVELDQLSRTPHLPGYILSEVSHRPDRAHQLISELTGIRPEQARPMAFAALGRQIDERVRAGKMVNITPEQFVVNLVSLCIFPFAARPILIEMLGLDPEGFRRFIDERRKLLAPLILRGLRP